MMITVRATAARGALSLFLTTLRVNQFDDRGLASTPRKTRQGSTLRPIEVNEALVSY